MDTRTRIFGLVLGAIALVGCATEDPGLDEDNIVDVEDPEAKADGPGVPRGTFVINSPNAPRDLFRKIALRSTADNEQRFIAEGRDPIDPSFTVSSEGGFKITRYQGQRFIRLLNDDGSLIARYRFESSEGGLRLWPRGATTAVRFDRAERAFCGEPEDCYGQGIIVPACVGTFSCEAQACQYQCGHVEARTTVTETSERELAPVSLHLEDSFGSDDGSVVAVPLFFDVVRAPIFGPGPNAPTLESVLAAVSARLENGPDALHTFVAPGTLGSNGQITERTLQRYLRDWNARALFDTYEEEVLNRDEVGGAIEIGKVSGRGESTMFDEGGSEVDASAYVVYYPTLHKAFVLLGLRDRTQ